MDPYRCKELLGKFNNARVLVVGDIYLDENVFGVVSGVSLEAPVMVYEVRERRHNPGAAGNAACNVAALGAQTFMIGYVGNDINADIVRREFAIRNVDVSHVVVHPSRPTNTYGKLRAGGHNTPDQEILRTDTPSPIFLEPDIENQVIANIQNLAPEVDAIVVVDQVSSVATERVLQTVVECAKKHNLITVGDSRKRAGALKGFDVVVPNDREAGIGTGVDVVDETSLNLAGANLLKVCKSALVTRGPHGIRIYEQNRNITDSPSGALPSEVVDVTGAGDTVTAAVAVTLVSGGSLQEAALIGNVAAGIAVKLPGVVTVPRAQLERALLREATPPKVRSLDELEEWVQNRRGEGKTIVWTNGCFDILHAGHIRYLQNAAELGDVLVVGLNSDESVRENKGQGRPVVPESERALVLAALECVSNVTIFGEKNTVSILDRIKPDVYAKGGDYTLDTIVQEERAVVERNGGRVAIVPGIDGHSTTGIIARIKE